MASKVYRSANGKSVDMGKLLLQNEHVMAVGNMNVNARGDQLNTKTQRSIQTRAETVTKHYEKQVQTNVTDEPIYSTIPEKKPVVNPKAAKTAAVKKKPAKKEKEQELEIVDFDEEVFSEIPLADVEEPVAEEPVAEEPAESGGLAAAIARAKEVKQEPLPKPGTPTKPSRF